MIKNLLVIISFLIVSLFFISASHARIEIVPVVKCDKNKTLIELSNFDTLINEYLKILDDEKYKLDFYNFLTSFGEWYKFRENHISFYNDCYNLTSAIKNNLIKDNINKNSLSINQFGYYIKISNKVDIPCEKLEYLSNPTFTCKGMEANFTNNNTLNILGSIENFSDSRIC